MSSRIAKVITYNLSRCGSSNKNKREYFISFGINLFVVEDNLIPRMPDRPKKSKSKTSCEPSVPQQKRKRKALVIKESRIRTERKPMKPSSSDKYILQYHNVWHCGWNCVTPSAKQRLLALRWVSGIVEAKHLL